MHGTLQIEWPFTPLWMFTISGVHLLRLYGNRRTFYCDDFIVPRRKLTRIADSNGVKFPYSLQKLLTDPRMASSYRFCNRIKALYFAIHIMHNVTKNCVRKHIIFLSWHNIVLYRPSVRRQVARYPYRIKPTMSTLLSVASLLGTHRYSAKRRVVVGCVVVRHDNKQWP